MKISILDVLLLIHLSSVNHTVSAVKDDEEFYSCLPDTIGKCINIPSNTTIRLPKSFKHEILILTRVTGRGVKELEVVPVGRSYYARKWEAVAGPYDDVVFDCGIGNGLCQVSTPQTVHADQVFSLSRFEHRLSVRDKIARFLEQVTFGTKRNDLNDLNQSARKNNNNLRKTFSSWVDKQINQIPPTSHREFFRSRAAPRYIDRSPTFEGKMYHPCSAGSRWRRFSFALPDLQKDLSITKVSNRYALSIDGHVRTMIDNINFKKMKGSKEEVRFEYTEPTSYPICAIGKAGTFNYLAIRYKDECRSFVTGNPPVDIDGMDHQPTYVLDAIDPTAFITKFGHDDSKSKIESMLSTTNIFDDYPALCESLSLQYNTPVYARLISGQVLVFDPVLKFETNTLVTPLDDGGGITSISTGQITQCANVPRTFLNDADCRLSSVAACTSSENTIDLSLELTGENLKELYHKTGRYYYVVQGLRLGETDDAFWGVEFPCHKSARSRWIQMPNNNCDQNIEAETAKIFSSRWADDSNPHMTDILFPGGEECHTNDKEKMKLIIKTDKGQCWKNIHPHEFNVFDFTFWASNNEGAHPGNSLARNPIKEFAEAGNHRLIFPLWHDMNRWYSNTGTAVLEIGRFGDSIAFKDLSEVLKRDVLLILGLLSNSDDSSRGTVVCGSPGEVGNNFPSVDTFDETDRNGALQLNNNNGFLQERYHRQRKQVWTEVALKAPDQLRQRVAWALAQIFAITPDAMGKAFNTEMFVTYYDIFTRNAFRTYKDVLKEVAYSPLMAEMLTFYQSKSTEYIWNTRNELQFTDENFAREVMQLFTVGTEKLKIDGTIVLSDSSGKGIPVYSNEDIIEYSRAWTGFDRQQLRGNIEQHSEYKNSIDPMRIQIEWRDRYPKMGLEGQYVGDQYMICADLPYQMFLREGARYRLLGNEKESRLQHVQRESQGNVVVHVLDASSELAAELCQDSNGKCQFPSSVELNLNINCFGVECGLGIVQIVQVRDIYYEYLKPACINFPFFNTGKTVLKRLEDGSDTGSGCVDETLQSNSAYYFGHFTFTRDSCNVFVVVDTNGKIAIEEENTIDYASLTYFRVHWQNNKFPHEANNNCGGKTLCQIAQGRCRCRVGIRDQVKFTKLPSRNDVLSQLSIGAIPTKMMDYHSMITTQDGINVYFKFQTNTYDKDTAFEVTDKFGRRRLLKNMMSLVRFRQSSGQLSKNYTFRNPPVFHNAIPELRNAQFETEAVLDHYMYHPNTAPFVSLRLLQRFGISNPSPGFLSSVSLAFTTGLYYHQTGPDSITFGSSNYGDLAATVAAIILHAESRREVLDADPMHGSLREPLIKVISMMRNLEYEEQGGARGEDFISLGGMENKIGQMAYEMPDVFSFFLPTYSAPGAISSAALYSPEAMLLHENIGLVNGMISMIKFGLSKCYKGFGDVYQYCPSFQKEGEFELSAGHLTFSPSSPENSEWVVNEIATLLTSGRMSKEKRQLLRESYNAEKDKEKALRHIQQLAIITPEFHATGLLTHEQGNLRPLPHANTKTCKPYKAVVHLMLYGGMDSFNLLVPYSGCGRHGYNQYKAVRGAAGMKLSQLLPINATGSSQACDTYGIHHGMSVLKNLYDQGEASFIAGIGVMTEPVTMEDYIDKTVTQLFAHDKMRAEIGRLDPFIESAGTGTLGRIIDALSKNGYNVNGFGIDTNLVTLEGVRKDLVKRAADSVTGFSTEFNPSANINDNLRADVRNLNRESDVHNNIFSDTMSASMIDSVFGNDEYYFAQLNGTAKMLNKEDSDIPIERKLQLIAKMIGSHDCRGADRDIFYTEHRHYDHHNNVRVGLNRRFKELNTALDSFIKEMKNQDKWKDVTIVVTSDFGRTLSPNTGGGTDHGWSGNSFVMGGSVAGGTILGDYPEQFDSRSPLNIGRGRLLPTRPWESLWNPVSQWLGITESNDLNEVLPNQKNFPPQSLIQVSDMFHHFSSNTVINCADEGTSISCDPDKQFSNIPTLSPFLTFPTTNPTLHVTDVPSKAPTVIPPTNTPSEVGSEVPTTVIQSSQPSSNLSELPSVRSTDFCQDSKEKILWKGKKQACKFFGQKNTSKRCNSSWKARNNCPVTCQKGCTCYDTKGLFYVKFVGNTKEDCNWVAEDVNNRCKLAKPYANCPITCGVC